MSTADNKELFLTVGADRYFEDYEEGAVHRFGPIRVEQAEIIEFATRYDPHTFHTDPERAANSAFGGLIASGWHTCSMMMRLFFDYFLSDVSSLGSPGMSQLRWLMPVRPGDELSVRATIREARGSRSKPDRGLVTTFIEVLNQHEDVVMDLEAVNLISRNSPSETLTE